MNQLKIDSTMRAFVRTLCVSEHSPLETQFRKIIIDFIREDCDNARTSE